MGGRYRHRGSDVNEVAKIGEESEREGKGGKEKRDNGGGRDVVEERKVIK